MSLCAENERWDWLRPGRFAVLLGLLTLAAHPQVALGLRTFVARDFGLYTYPLALYQRESFWRGEWPLWNPFIACGVPHLAQWNTLALYPPSLLYLLLPLPWSLNCFCLLHQFWAGLGMYFLAYRWTEHRLAAAVAGIGFAFNGVTDSSLTWSCIMAGLGWMPWVVWWGERAWNEGGRAMLWAAAAGAMQMLSGAPEVILLTWIVLGTLWLSEGLKARSELGIRLWRFGLLVLLIAGLAAVQLVPFLDLLQHSQRTAAAGTHDKWWVPLSGIANLLVPSFRVTELTCGLAFPGNQSWLPSFYPGIGLLALGVWGGMNWRTWRARWLAGLLLLSLWLALGNPGGLLYCLRRVVPVLDLIRFPVKYLILGSFVLPLLAAVAVRNWAAATPTQRVALERQAAWLLLALGLTLAGILAATWVGKPEPGELLRNAGSGLSRGLFLAALAGLGVSLPRLAAGRKQQWVTLSCLGLLWLDVLTSGPSANPTASASVFAVPGPAPSLMSAAPLVGQGRAMTSLEVADVLDKKSLPKVDTTFLVHRLGLHGNCNLLDHIPVVGGFFPLLPAQSMELYPRLFENDGAPRTEWADFLGVTQVMLSGDALKWQFRKTARPLITAGLKPVFAEPSNTLSLVESRQFNPALEVILPPEAQAVVSASGSHPAKVTDSQFSPQRITFKVEAQEPSLVVIAQTYYHCWRAQVEGQSIPLWRADHGFQALQVPAGRHEVQLLYQDSPFKIGACISLLTVVCFGAAWYRLRFR